MVDHSRPRVDIPAQEISPLAFAVALSVRHTVARVDQAMRSGRVRLAFQPVVMGQDTGRIAFHEGLIRIIDPSGLPIPAADFITAVEPTEIGRRIDCAALELGLRTLKAHPGLRLSVNMSARSIGYTGWTQLLRRALASSPTLGERLILEITETSALTVPELVIAFMDEFRSAGITFALDDFGAGMTSLRYLMDFAFDMIKLDGQFIRNVADDPDNQALVRAMLSIAGHFEMVTVAESVERQADADFLRAAGVGAMQGFLFGAPTVRPPWSETARRTG